MASVDRPLIIEAEGRDQDERSALAAAVCALLNRTDRRRVTDLHVFELIKYVHRLDRSKHGAQLSHYQIAKALWLEVRTARAVLARCTDELGLLLKIEQRYVTNGQQANRYQIDWQRVRAINRGHIALASGPGDTTCQPPDTTCQPPDTTCQPPDTMCHPYKEHSGILPESKPESPPTPGTRACAAQVQEEEEVLVCREESPEALASLVAAFTQAKVYDAAEVVSRACDRVGCEYLQRLLEYWSVNHKRFDGAGALRLRLKRSTPDLAIDDGWPPASRSITPRRQPTPSIDREAFLRAREESAAIAASDVPMAVQLQRLRERALGGAPSS